MTQGLPVSRLINVTVNLTPQLARFPNFNTCLLVGISDVIPLVERMREYASLSEVAADFGTAAPEYLGAQLWFGQNPAPEDLLIGRWAKANTAGQLVGGTVAAANQEVDAWTAINNGAFQLELDGVGPTEYGNLDFSAVTNMNGVATVITTAFPGGSAVCVWDAERQRFVITSDTAGEASSVSFMTEPNAGTDISQMLNMRQGNGAQESPGVDAQSALETFEIFNNDFSSQFYGYVMLETDDEESLAVAAAIEASEPAHYFGVTTMDAATLVAGDTACLAYEMKQLGVSNSMVQYSSSSPYAVLSALARILTTNWQAQNSVITLMFKNEPLVAAEYLTSAQVSALLAKNANVFVEYNNNTAIIEPGWSPSGQFTDSVIGCDWMAAAIQNALYNALYSTQTKIPQTDAGMAVLASQIDSVCAQAVRNGLLAPGTWNQQGFGQIKQGDYLPLGYYIYTPPIASQSQADRAARKSVPFQVAAKLGGAVHSVDVAVQVEA